MCLLIEIRHNIQCHGICIEINSIICLKMAFFRTTLHNLGALKGDFRGGGCPNDTQGPCRGRPCHTVGDICEQLDSISFVV